MHHEKSTTSDLIGTIYTALCNDFNVLSKRTEIHSLKTFMKVKLPDLESKTILYNTGLYDKCKNVKLINHCINMYKQIVFINKGELLLYCL